MDQTEIYCSLYCQEEGVPVTATAMKSSAKESFDGFVLVEAKSSLTRKIETQDDYFGELADIISESKDDQYRLQAILPDIQYNNSSKVKVIIYKNQSMGFSDKFEYKVEITDLTNLLSDFLEGSTDSFKQESNSYKRDMLVCTHGQRDKCCGRFGYPIYKFLRENANKGIRVWRSSHISGHRMAPTMIDLPSGRYWGYLNKDIASKIMHQRKLTPREVEKHYRGLSGLTVSEQVAEKEFIKKEGWSYGKFPNDITSHKTSKGKMVSIKKDGKSINVLVDQEPNKIQIGKTKCSKVKPVKQYNFDLFDD